MSMSNLARTYSESSVVIPTPKRHNWRDSRLRQWLVRTNYHAAETMHPQRPGESSVGASLLATDRTPDPILLVP